MQIIYYEWHTRRIVYYYEHDHFDVEFGIPGLRVAHYNNEKPFHGDLQYFSWAWDVNTIIPNSFMVTDELSLLRYKCCCSHDITRLHNIMKIKMRHDPIQFLDVEGADGFIKHNNELIEDLFKSHTKPILSRLLSSKTYSEAQEVYRDWWVSTRHVDDLVDYKFNKLI